VTGKKGQRAFGSIRQLPSRRWQARYRDRLGQVQCQTFFTKADAGAYLAEMQTDLARGTWRDPGDGRMLLRDYCTEWLASDLAKAPTTKARDAVVMRAHILPTLGNLALAEITPRDVQRVVQRMSLSLSPKTVRTNAGVLQAVLNSAVREGRLYASPYRSPKMPQLVARERRRLTFEQQRRLAAAVGEEYGIMVFLAGVLGLRWSEVAGLRRKDINFFARPVALRAERPLVEVSGRHVASRGKTPGSRAVLTVPPFLADLLSWHLARVGRSDPDDLVVQAPRGGPLHAVNFRARVWAPAVEACGFEGLTFHDLRHSAAGVMGLAGASDQVVQHRMRHTHRPTTSDIYGWTPDAMDMVALEALEKLWHQEDRTNLGDGRVGA
jgi:integrase